MRRLELIAHRKVRAAFLAWSNFTVNVRKSIFWLVVIDFALASVIGFALTVLALAYFGVLTP